LRSARTPCGGAPAATPVRLPARGPPSARRGRRLPSRSRSWLAARSQAGVTVRFELERPCAVARSHDAPSLQYADAIGHDVVQKPLVVRDDENAAIGAP